MTTTGSDYLKLHFLVFLWGFTGILGKLVSIPAVEMVFYRTLLAAAGMASLLAVGKGTFRISTRDFLIIFFTGFIVSAHWLTFFLSGRVANVSVSLVGFATASLWTALLEPIAKGYKIRTAEVAFGLIVLSGLYIVFSSDFGYSWGLILGIISGLTCAIFAIINSMMVKRVDASAITFYEMTGACVATALFFPLYLENWSGVNPLNLDATPIDWLWIALLAWLCTVYAYSAAIELMKKISAFSFQLTLNLEPVYGIVMAVIVFGEEERMTTNFYVGAAIILCAVLAFPAIKNKFKAIQTSSPPL